MSDFKATDRVRTSREIRAGRGEDGPYVCTKGVEGDVVKIEPSEWDSVHVQLDTGVLWWFKPSQLESAKKHT